MLRIASFAVAATLGLHAASAAAAPGRVCMQRAQALEVLASQFSEEPRAMGLTNTGAIIEVLVDEEGDTWTIVFTTPQGITCLVAAGQHWEEVARAARGPEA